MPFCLYGSPIRPIIYSLWAYRRDFSKNRKKETATKDSTEVKADKDITSDIYEKKRSETIKEKKESTLLKQIGFACVYVTVLIVVMLIVKHWCNRQSSS